MRKFKCSICGFIYDETAGLSEKGINPGTKWDDISPDFVCPWCGAAKTMFDEFNDNRHVDAPSMKEDNQSQPLGELTAGELSVLCSNLAKGCEKQYLNEEMNLFNQLADYFAKQTLSQNGQNLAEIAKLLNTDLSESYSKANAVAAAELDRGALRALVWSEKVSRMLEAHIARHTKEGNAMLEDASIYVCDICGFVYLGNELPEVCPICKVPNFKILPVGRS